MFRVPAVIVSHDQISFNLGHSMLLLVGVERPIMPLSAEFKLAHYESVEMFSRALQYHAMRIPTSEERKLKCLDPDGNILTFILPERTESYYIYFAGPEFIPEPNELHVKADGGNYFIGRGRRPGHPVYRSREEAETALENRRSVTAPLQIVL